MDINDWRKEQIEDIESWADTIDQILTPDKVIPKTLHEYPHYMNICEKLKLVCQRKEQHLSEQVTTIKDALMRTIEKEKYVFKQHKQTGLTEFKKRYTTAAARERELRLRLANDEAYIQLEQERSDWALMVKDWRSYFDKLRREFRILEGDYLHNGGTTITINKITHENRKV